MQDADESVDSTSRVLVSIMMSVSLSNTGKSLKFRHYDISRAYFQGTMERLTHIRLSAEDRQKYDEDKVGRWVKSMYGTPHLAAWLCEMDLWRVRKLSKRQT